jgi:hypothetical protein
MAGASGCYRIGIAGLTFFNITSLSHSSEAHFMLSHAGARVQELEFEKFACVYT